MATTKTTTEYKTLRFEIETGTSDATGKPVFLAKCFRGNSAKHLWCYRFKSQERLDAQVQYQKDDQDKIDDLRASRKAAQAEGVAKMTEVIQVGTILCYSWGWEQTNCSFFQVTEKKNRNVTLRAIGAELTTGDGGHSMSGCVAPKPGAFLEGEPEIKKVIGQCGVSMDHGLASPTEPGEKHYCSWYA